MAQKHNWSPGPNIHSSYSHLGNICQHAPSSARQNRESSPGNHATTAPPLRKNACQHTFSFISSTAISSSAHRHSHMLLCCHAPHASRLCSFSLHFRPVVACNSRPLERLRSDAHDPSTRRGTAPFPLRALLRAALWAAQGDPLAGNPSVVPFFCFEKPSAWPQHQISTPCAIDAMFDCYPTGRDWSGTLQFRIVRHGCFGHVSTLLHIFISTFRESSTDSAKSRAIASIQHFGLRTGPDPIKASREACAMLAVGGTERGAASCFPFPSPS
ncbi:hypothetical protein M011DRAFT_56168 [Sporormia fimetaria CBS 119925]|uniref:Uncharacterized protein n=1 Tax=Sporormia fimetaria CBS 119925 TaxID=1340428 RepID=A0A6A6V9P4_9PLEO|nr:hypothetical protein M011DRAFT_56168 [Sporormia fimetaria CBS 119925]